MVWIIIGTSMVVTGLIIAGTTAAGWTAIRFVLNHLFDLE